MPFANRSIALVTPWFGEDQTNGSALLSSQLVRGLFASNHRVDVLTTCARSFGDDWSSNYYAEGVSHLENFTVRRFSVRSRDGEAFHRANHFLLSQPLEFLKAHPRCIPADLADAFCRENIQSPGLLKYLSDWGRGYGAILFTPYLYGPVLAGVEIAGARSFLQPCLHDEAYAYLPQVARLFRRARGLLFNSRAEFDLARRFYGPEIGPKSTIVGHWVAVPESETVMDRAVPRERFVFYLGRMCESKNVSLIVKAFRDYRRYRPASRLQLVLAGDGGAFESGGGLRVLGRIGERRKAALLQSCAALLQPSINESFSRSVMEAWSYGKPVVINSECAPTAQAMRSCGAGWAASSLSEWIAALASIERATPGQLRELGGRGKAHYLQYGTPQRVLQRYREALGIAGEPAAAAHG
ncbi:MAG TPA: glycosyltransferase family 4 protein [Candidatus Rubrimentiphilum sp.]|nr:glycosyltransferase family 4 protein [Candidatus Rubrimentiphilum sp.]